MRRVYRLSLCLCTVSATVILHTRIENVIRVRLIKGLLIMAPVLPVSGVLLVSSGYRCYIVGTTLYVGMGFIMGRPYIRWVGTYRTGSPSYMAMLYTHMYHSVYHYLLPINTHAMHSSWYVSYPCYIP